MQNRESECYLSHLNPRKVLFLRYVQCIMVPVVLPYSRTCSSTSPIARIKIQVSSFCRCLILISQMLPHALSGGGVKGVCL